MCADLQVTGQPFDRQTAERLAISQGRTDAKDLTDLQLQEFLSTGKVSGLDTTAPAAPAAPAQPPAPIKGAELERTPKPEDKSVVARTQTQTTSLANLTSAMTKAGFKLDEKAVAELKTQLIAAGISVDESGNIDTSKPETIQKLNTTLAQFAQSKQETQLKFDKSTDQEFIDKMVSDGAICQNEDGTYTVLDKTKAEALLIMWIKNQHLKHNLLLHLRLMLKLRQKQLAESMLLKLKTILNTIEQAEERLRVTLKLNLNNGLLNLKMKIQ